MVLAALQGKIQQISGLELRLDEINEIPKNQRRLKSVEEHMKMLEQEEQKYQTLRRQLYEDMSNGIVSKDEYKEFSRSFNEKVENIRKAKTEMNRQLDSLNNLDLSRALFQGRYAQQQNRQKISCTARDLRQAWCRPSSKMFMYMRVGESLYSSNMSRVYRMP